MDCIYLYVVIEQTKSLSSLLLTLSSWGFSFNGWLSSSGSGGSGSTDGIDGTSMMTITNNIQNSLFGEVG